MFFVFPSNGSGGGDVSGICGEGFLSRKNGLAQAATLQVYICISTPFGVQFRTELPIGFLFRDHSISIDVGIA